jgi:dolichyl-phosphate-mannose-protein mannosyltransferase
MDLKRLLPKRWYPELIGLIVAGFATRITTLFTPNAVVFDEVYFKAFAAHYLDGHYYFDIHPPLAKLVLAGFAGLLGLSPEAMLDGTALPLRILPAIAGILLIPLVWALLRRLGVSRAFAFLGAFLVLLDNAILVESRFILMDSMLLLAGLGAVYLYLVARDTKGRLHWLWLALAAASAGAAMSIKWTGISALGVIGLVWLWDQRGRDAAALRRRAVELAIFAIIPLSIYVSAFWAHFQLLPKSGEGDAFMSPRFQATLIGSPTYDPTTRLSFTQKFQELNYEMFQANQTLTATHPYGSSWHSWPLELRSIYYWQGDQLQNGRQGHIYLLGNPIIWWGIWVAIIWGLIRLRRHHLRPTTVASLALAGSAYLINFLPFTAVSRVMFLYHYFFSFLFSLIFAVLLWNDLATNKDGRQLTKPTHRRVFGAVLVAVALGFIFFAPLSYGLPLSPEGLQARMWLPSWR